MGHFFICLKECKHCWQYLFVFGDQFLFFNVIKWEISIHFKHPSNLHVTENYDTPQIRNHVPEIQLYLGNDKIEYRENHTCLGIILDRKLKGKSHISQIADRGK
jgi:hypothetical protein